MKNFFDKLKINSVELDFKYVYIKELNSLKTIDEFIIFLKSNNFSVISRYDYFGETFVEYYKFHSIYHFNEFITYSLIINYSSTVINFKKKLKK